MGKEQVYFKDSKEKAITRIQDILLKSVLIRIKIGNKKFITTAPKNGRLNGFVR